MTLMSHGKPELLLLKIYITRERNAPAWGEILVNPHSVEPS